MIYFDAAATTLQKPPHVAEQLLRGLQRGGNPGRGGHAAASFAAEEVFTTRTLASELFDCSPEQVVFTMNATHALNLAIHSAVSPGERVMISGFEHNAVVRPLHALGCRLAVAGRELFHEEATLQEVEKQLKRAPAAAIFTHVSNVFGYVLPLEEIAARCAYYHVPLIVDASQSAGSIPVQLGKLQAAFLAMPGHKGLYGPQGTGILICGAETTPLLFGGTGSVSEARDMPDYLPDRLEAGTLNVPGIAGLGAGLRFVLSQKPEKIFRHETRLRQLAAAGLAQIPGIQLFTGQPQSGVLSFTLQERDCENVAQSLAAHGVAVRAGLHCAPLAHESAGTIQTGTVRVSFSAFNTEQEVRRFVQIVKDLGNQEREQGK